MPQSSGKKLKGMLGSFDQHKADETKMPKGGGDLPAGINNGIAQLVAIKGDVHEDGANKGKDYIYLAGIVVDTEPEFRTAIGGRTSKVIGLYPTKDGKKSRSDKEGEFLNELRLLGLETKHLNASDIDAAIDELVKQGPYFKFQTWKGEPTKDFPNPRVNHKWMGVTDWSPDGGSSAVNDNSGNDESNDDSSSEPVGDNWEEIGQQADGGDGDAEEKLIEAAKANGFSMKDIEKVKSWTLLGQQLNEKLGTASGGGDEPQPDEEEPTSEPWKPEVGQVYKYKPKGYRNKVDIEITKVFSKTLNAKEVDGGKVHTAIPWSADPDTIGGQPAE